MPLSKTKPKFDALVDNEQKDKFFLYFYSSTYLSHSITLCLLGLAEKSRSVQTKKIDLRVRFKKV